MTMINIHTHIFSWDQLPTREVQDIKIRLLRRSPWLLTKGIIPVLKFLGRDISLLKKYAALAEIGTTRSQADIFRKMVSAYPAGDNRFVVLPMDFEFSMAGIPTVGTKAQHDELAQMILNEEFAGKLLPFVATDPRRWEITEFVKGYIERKGFVGLKLYPAQGFYPSDSRMEEVWKFVEANGVPMLTHCDTGGVHFELEQPVAEQLNPNLFSGESIRPHNCNIKQFRYYFGDPTRFEWALKKYPKAKICFAHFGGSEMIRDHVSSGSQVLKEINGKAGGTVIEKNWTTQILELIKNPAYPNVYTDISYTLHNRDTWDFIRKCVQDPQISDYILFGTDFYMVSREKPEDALVREFVNQSKLSPQEWTKISVDNPRKFLQSKFYP